MPVIKLAKHERDGQQHFAQDDDIQQAITLDHVMAVKGDPLDQARATGTSNSITKIPMQIGIKIALSGVTVNYITTHSTCAMINPIA